MSLKLGFHFLKDKRRLRSHKNLNLDVHKVSSKKSKYFYTDNELQHNNFYSEKLLKTLRSIFQFWYSVNIARKLGYSCHIRTTTLKIDGNFFSVYYTFKTNAIHHAKFLNKFFGAPL